MNLYKTAIVIGGGIAGCSTAFALANRGISVTLLERQSTLAAGASGNPLAALYPKLSLNKSLTDKLTMQGFSFTQQLLQSLPNASNFYEICGQIQLGFNAREQARQIELARLYELPLLNAEAASEQAGISLKVGGIYFTQAAWLKPIAFCKALCQHTNINIHTFAEALRIEQVQHRWRVLSNNRALEADMVVLCNANEIQQFVQTRSVDITPVRGQLNMFKQTPESASIKTLICSDHYLSPTVDGWNVIGTTYAPNDMDASIREQDTLENMQALRTISAKIYESIDMQTISGRVAWRSQTRDYVPLAGRVIDAEKLREKTPRYNTKPAELAWLNGLFVNAGHGSKGMISAPICAELIACLATSADLPFSSELAVKLNPNRFLLRELGLKQLANSLY